MKKRFKRLFEQHSTLFRDAKDEISGKNIRMLKHASLITTLLVVFFIILTPYLVPNWVATWQYILFAPIMFVFFILSFIISMKKERNYYATQFLICLYSITLFAFIIAIDVFAYPNSSSTYMPVVLLVVPLVFILPFWLVFTSSTIIDIIYILLVVHFKTDKYQVSDIFSSLVSLLFIYFVDTVIMQAQFENLYDKMRFKAMSTLDQLTNVSNKKSCEHRIISYLANRSEEDLYSLMIIDVDNFKTINDDYGHQAGDKVLSAIGVILKEVFHPDDILGRIGGDEFMVLLRNKESLDHYEHKCERIQSSVKTILEDSGKKVTCSIGLTTPSNQSIAFSELYTIADNALYKAKENGRDCVVVS